MSEFVHAFDEEEDNNPFSSTRGLTSLINSRVDDPNGSPQDPSDPSHDPSQDELVLLYASKKRSDDGRVPINYESRVTKLLNPNSRVKLQITEASNSNEGALNSLKKYVVYTIRLTSVNNPNDDIQTRRRYLDFESLRDILTKIFPLVIVPPIPPKNYFNLNVLNGLVSSLVATNMPSTMPNNGNLPLNHTQQQHNHHHHHHHQARVATLGPEMGKEDSKSVIGLPTNNYAYINLNHLNKHKLVEHRKRLLTNFLNNCLQIPKIRNLQFFAKFLDPNANWLDEINLITSQLPKSVYQLNPENAIHTDPIYVNLPLPLSNIPFLNKIKKLVDDKGDSTGSNGSGKPGIEQGLDSEIIDTSVLDEINKRIMESFIGLLNDYTELGSVFNMFLIDFSDSDSGDYQNGSTNESSIKINQIFDLIGQVFDRLYITLNLLINDLETKFSEPLGEAVRYSLTLQLVRRFKDKKIKQATLLDREILEKKREFNELVAAESESQRVEGGGNSELQRNAKYDLVLRNSNNNGVGVKLSKYKVFLMLLIKKITQYVSDIIDQNPEETRKQKLMALQAKVEVLEKCQSHMVGDVAYISDELNKNFKDFHQMQLKMIYEILVCYNGFLLDWAKKNLEIWEEIKEEIRKL